MDISKKQYRSTGGKGDKIRSNSVLIPWNLTTLLAILIYTDYEHTKAKSQILCGPNSNKGLFFCRNNGWIMEFGPKCLPKPKSSKFLKKSSVWVSVVRAHLHEIFYYMNSFVCFLKIGEHWKKDPLLLFFFSLVKNNFLVFTCFDKNALSKRIKNLTLSNTLF